METKHTQGEWELQGEYDVVSNSIKEQGNIICCAPIGFNESMKYWKANAKLIAAAPELLEALDYLIKCNTIDRFKCETVDAIEKAKNAINKATK